MHRILGSLSIFTLAALQGCASVHADEQAAADTPATVSSPEPAAAPGVATMPHTLIVKSDFTFNKTDRRLREAINRRGPLTLFTTIDHGANAKGADLTLAPSRLYIFGSPNAGTPFMQANPAMGLQLPIRMLVFQDGDGVGIAFPDIEAIAADHGVSDEDAPIAGVARNIRAIAEEAANADDAGN